MPFEKGKSGNPLGRSKRDKLFETALKMQLLEAGESMPDLREIAAFLISEAKVNLAATKEFADRMDGKVPQGIIGGDEDDQPLQIVARWLTAGESKKE
jgi:hypothetical protein